MFVSNLQIIYYKQKALGNEERNLGFPMKKTKTISIEKVLFENGRGIGFYCEWIVYATLAS